MHAKHEDALEWAGDEPAAPQKPSLPEGWEAVGKGSERVVHEAKHGSRKGGDASPMGSAELLIVGVLVGVYLLYTIGWVIVGVRLHELQLLSGASYWFAVVCGVAAPALWFAAAWLLTRRAKSWVRLAALLGGIVLLIPWPFVTFGAMGVL